MSEKIKDMSLPAFAEKVKSSNEDLMKKLVENNVDADSIIAKTKPAVDKYGESTAIGYTVSRLKDALIEATSDSVKGMIVGAKDRYGTNAPVRIPLLSSSGDHTELVNWARS